MNRSRLGVGFALVLASTLVEPAAAAPTAKDKKLLKDVSEALLAVCDRPPTGIEWPPDVAFIDERGINAFATVVPRNGKLYSIVRVTDDMMSQVIEGDPHRLAYVLGHEIAHLLKKHVLVNPARAKTEFLRTTFTRDQEVEADLLGAELAIQAGYSFEKGLKAILRMKELGLDYSSFEGLSVDHPSWDARLEKMDKDKAHLWKAAAAFSNGVVFLITEQYPYAETCFEKVTKEFPASHEAWANLGFARLMRYCDQLDNADLKEFGIGHIVTGGFYLQAETIKVRGRNAELWRGAVAALKESNRLKAGQALVLANLGLAHLIRPEGKDVAEATRYLTEAESAAKSRDPVEPIAHAGLLINLGVANLAGGKPDAGLARLEEGEKMVRSMAGSIPLRRAAPTLDAALLYTRAMAQADSKNKADREKAADLLEEYLGFASRLSLWWGVAFDRYQELCKGIERKAKPADAFTKERAEPVRLAVGVKTKSGAGIVLGDDLDEVVKRLGKGKEMTVAPGTNLKRIRYEAEGVELLAKDEVLAIGLVGPNAPALPLQGQTPGAALAGTVKVGMTEDELAKVVGDLFDRGSLTAADVKYRFYRRVGIAVRLSDGKVAEVVVVRPPM